MNEPTSPRALVVGLGLSGVAASELLVRRGYSVLANDTASEEMLGSSLAALPGGVLVHTGGHPLELLAGISLVVVSPGVPWELPLLAVARERGIEVIAEVELAGRALAGVPIAGITGSNGKSTTTALLGAMAKAAGWRVGIGGNIGLAASRLAVEGGWDTVVLELSSFQLEGCSSLRPRVGLLLNLSPDHLDRHSSIADYLSLKARLFEFQDNRDFAVLNADDPALVNISPPSRISRFSLVDRRAEAHLDGQDLVLDGRPLLPRERLRLIGSHNIANALAAALGAARLGVPAEAIAATLESFEGLPHRHRVVAETGGVRYIDDSKGTNIGATAAGLTGYRPGSVHLVLGGLGKGQDFSELREVVAERARCVYLIGAAAGAIAAALKEVVPLESCGDIEEALRRASKSAEPGEVVLLSPACASFDQFRDYGHRGDEFARLARRIAGDD